ncbi:MAG: glycosyltransferase [Chloroflexi bacterium]|nr:glycosyltransferase [Chloroflexota bacterium]
MNPEKTVVFPWGIDLGHFQPADREETNRLAFTLFCNRSWELRYGVDLLAHAFVKVAGKHDHVDLILLSGGSQASNIRGILQSGGVLDRVTFGGQVSQMNLPDWYHMADLYISPSHVDGSSVSLMEALACGLPCLVSDIPANREWITEGENGWLFRDGDVDHLVERICMAIDQREYLPVIGRAGRRTAERQADWNRNAAVLMDTYQNMIERDMHAHV